jgi:hypothetical protein
MLRIFILSLFVRRQYGPAIRHVGGQIRTVDETVHQQQLFNLFGEKSSSSCGDHAIGFQRATGQSASKLISTMLPIPTIKKFKT